MDHLHKNKPPCTNRRSRSPLTIGAVTPSLSLPVLSRFLPCPPGEGHSRSQYGRRSSANNCVLCVLCVFTCGCDCVRVCPEYVCVCVCVCVCGYCVNLVHVTAREVIGPARARSFGLCVYVYVCVFCVCVVCVALTNSVEISALRLVNKKEIYLMQFETEKLPRNNLY